jgi:hypothetical protein
MQMLKEFFSLSVSGILLTGSISVAWAGPAQTVRQSPDAALPQRLVAGARQMISDFKVTSYSHRTFIDRGRSVCEVDCSGFLVALLKQSSPEHLRQIATRHKRALAEDFYAAFSGTNRDSSRGWRPVKRLQDVEPGDVIAWLKQERQPGDNTGHVMLVEGKPTADSPHQFRVRVLDSTLHGHGSDSRPEGKSGIGAGTIWLTVDDEGRPIGYRWKSRHGMLHQAPISIGRAVGEAAVSPYQSRQGPKS